MYNQDDDLVFHKACKLLMPFNTNQIALSRETNIASDLEIDSVAIMNLIMEVEDAYDISFPMNLIAEIKTVGDLVDTVHQLKRE